LKVVPFGAVTGLLVLFYVFFFISLCCLMLSYSDFSLHGRVCRRISHFRVLSLSVYICGMIGQCRILIISGCMFRSISHCSKLSLIGCMCKRIIYFMCKCGGSIRYWCDFLRSRYSGFIDDRSFSLLASCLRSSQICQ